MSNAIDFALLNKPNYNVIIVGDFNRHGFSRLTSDFDLCNILNDVTRNAAMIDLILVDAALADVYSVHRAIAAKPKVGFISKVNYISTYDLSSRNIESLLVFYITLNGVFSGVLMTVTVFNDVFFKGCYSSHSCYLCCCF